jgi:hypothetical protein
MEISVDFRGIAVVVEFDVDPGQRGSFDQPGYSLSIEINAVLFENEGKTLVDGLRWVPAMVKTDISCLLQGEDFVELETLVWHELEKAQDDDY